MFVDRQYDSSEHIGFPRATRSMQEDSSNHVLSTSMRSRVEKVTGKVDTFQNTPKITRNRLWHQPERSHKQAPPTNRQKNKNMPEQLSSQAPASPMPATREGGHVCRNNAADLAHPPWPIISARALSPTHMPCTDLARFGTYHQPGV